LYRGWKLLIFRRDTDFQDGGHLVVKEYISGLRELTGCGTR
jgi:hypothetical protein